MRYTDLDTPPTCKEICLRRRSIFEPRCRLDPSSVRSNLFTLEWPPHSGRMAQFPEVDRADFFSLREAKKKIKAAQYALLEELALILKNSGKHGTL